MTQIIIAILAAITLGGIIVLTYLGIDVPTILTTIGSALVGWLVGKNNETIAGALGIGRK